MAIRALNVNRSFCLAWLFVCGHVCAYTTTWHAKDAVVGHMQSTVSRPGENFYEVAHRMGVGWNALRAANPSVDPAHLQPYTLMMIPHLYLLPKVRKGIVVNLAEKRLFYFKPKAHQVMILPVGVALVGWDTPTGSMKIAEKKYRPVWIVPKSILKWRKAHGDPLPRVVQPGPENPLGLYALRLSRPNYLIHGTNAPEGVGQRTTAGCLHLYAEDIKALYHQVPVGTRVRIVNQPYEFAWHHGVLYFESHVPMVPMTAAQEREAAAVQLQKALRGVKGVVVLRPQLIQYHLNKVVKVPVAVGYLA